MAWLNCYRCHNVTATDKNIWINPNTSNYKLNLYENVSFSPLKVSWSTNVRINFNWPQLTLLLMLTESGQFTFCQWAHGCHVSVVKNYLKNLFLPSFVDLFLCKVNAA